MYYRSCAGKTAEHLGIDQTWIRLGGDDQAAPDGPAHFLCDKLIQPLDLFMTHLRGESNTLYLNRGGWFDDATVSAGLAAPSVATTGFGMGFADFDHDGALDLLVVNGRVGRSLTPLAEDPYAEPDQLYRGLGTGRFAEIPSREMLPLPLIETGRGAAFGDVDNDGDVDVAIVNNGGRARLLENLAGDRGHWILFRLIVARVAEVPSARSLSSIWNFGGATARVPAAATAFGARDMPYMFSIDSIWDEAEDDATNIDWTRDLWRDLQEHSHEGRMYLNFPGLGEEGEALIKRSVGANYGRLAAIKQKYDPDNLFRFNQNIPPAG